MLPCAAALLLMASPTARETVREVYAAHSYQLELPGEATDGTAEAEVRRGLLDLNLDALAPVINALFWAGAMVGALLLALKLANALRGTSRASEEADETAREAPLGDAPLQDAEALAARGQFADAIHVLLLRTFEHLVRRAGARLAPAWTSREVLARISCPDSAREVLVDLVDAVELCWFAGAVPNEDDYRRCADRFRAFSAAFKGGVA